MLSQMPSQASMALSTRHVDPLHAPVQQYAVQHFDTFASNKPLSPLRSPARSRHHPYSQGATETGHQRRKSSELGGGGDGKNTLKGSVRRRISRACDQCNQLRTKCDGKGPCAHCVGKQGYFFPEAELI